MKRINYVVCRLKDKRVMHAANYRCHVGEVVLTGTADDVESAKRKAETWCALAVDVCRCCYQATATT